MADPMKQQYVCEVHGDIAAAVMTVLGYDRETGDTVDEFVGCVRCYVEFLRENVTVAKPVGPGPEDKETEH